MYNYVACILLRFGNISVSNSEGVQYQNDYGILIFNNLNSDNKDTVNNGYKNIYL